MIKHKLVFFSLLVFSFSLPCALAANSEPEVSDILNAKQPDSLFREIRPYDGRLIEYRGYGHFKRTEDGCVVRQKRGISKAKLTFMQKHEVPSEFIEAVTIFNDDYQSGKFTSGFIEKVKKTGELYKLISSNLFVEKKHADLAPYEKYIRDYRYDEEWGCYKNLQPYSEEIATLFLPLAQKGYEPAILWLSLIHEKGIGTPVNRIEAYAWRAVSVAMHRPHGQNRLDKISQQMSHEDVNRAEALAFKYMKQHTTLFDGPTTVIYQKQN